MGSEFRESITKSLKKVVYVPKEALKFFEKPLLLDTVNSAWINFPSNLDTVNGFWITVRFYLATVKRLSYTIGQAYMTNGGTELNNRIKTIRKEVAKLNQVQFGARIGLTGGAVSLIESGARSVSNAIILNICREWSISEEWLRTGEGTMHMKGSRIMSKETEGYTPSIRSIIELASQLSPEFQECAQEQLRRLVVLQNGLRSQADAAAAYPQTLNTLHELSDKVKQIEKQLSRPQPKQPLQPERRSQVAITGFTSRDEAVKILSVLCKSPRFVIKHIYDTSSSTKGILLGYKDRGYIYFIPSRLHNAFIQHIREEQQNAYIGKNHFIQLLHDMQIAQSGFRKDTTLQQINRGAARGWYITIPEADIYN